MAEHQDMQHEPVVPEVKKQTKSKAKPKAKKSAESSSSNQPKTSYIDMIKQAIVQLRHKGKRGSSREAILKYIMAEFKLEDKHARQYVNPALRRGVQTGVLKQLKGKGANGSFMIGEAAQSKPKKRATNKPASKTAKPKVTKKKAVSKDTAAAKTKAAPKKPKEAKQPRKPKEPKQAKTKSAKQEAAASA